MREKRVRIETGRFVQNKEKTESADTDPASAPVRIASLIERSSTTFGVFARFIS